MQATRHISRATRLASFARHAQLRSHFGTRATPLFAKKGAEDRDTLDPQSNEYSKSGSDGQAAQTSAAFDPKTTDPDTQERQAAQDAGSEADNSLNASPANTDIRGWNPSAEKGGQDGQNKDEAQKRREAQASGGGSPNKAGGGPGGTRPSGV